jgi:4-diphosphocytidyl-2-C-methyl-D-erythritol kinase
MAATEGDGWSRWPAPAKINLFLHVVGRRADGYHELQTVFRLLDFGDEIALRVRPDGQVVRHAGLPGLPPEQDLVVRAARALQQASGTPLGADIAVDKRIPAGGGLGGGSSDAATVLRALDHLWGTGLGVERLAAIGLALGADVPVFVHGRSAWAEGVGERLVPVDLPPQAYVVVDPAEAVPTGPVFQAPELTRNTPRTTIRGFLDGSTMRNDLEPVVRRRHPAVDAALTWLGRHAPARLTGSGGCVFAAVRDRAAGQVIAAACPPPWRAFVAEACDESPLLRRLGAPAAGR